MTITLAPQFTQRSYRWTTWKEVEAKKGGQHQCDDDGSTYTVWFYDGPEVHVCTIWKASVPHSVVDSGYTQEQNDEDKADFEAGYLLDANGTLNPRELDGRPRTALGKGMGVPFNVYTHNFCDRTTWFQDSLRVVGETPTDSGNHTTYSLAHPNVIDTGHGKVTFEDGLVDAAGHSYRVAVSVNGVAKAERQWPAPTGGDFTVDYGAGTVTFAAALDAGDDVLATYHYARTSMFKIVPPAGKMLTLDNAKYSFAPDDVVMTDSFVFEVWGIADYFVPPAAMAALGIPSGVGYKIKI